MLVLVKVLVDLTTDSDQIPAPDLQYPLKNYTFQLENFELVISLFSSRWRHETSDTTHIYEHRKELSYARSHASVCFFKWI